MAGQSAWVCSVQVPSCYPSNAPGPLPARMSWATPDLKAAIARIGEDVAARGGRFALSDLFRSYEMQLQAHLDYTSGKKSAFSPAPGGSMHEAGRAFDVVIPDLKMSLADFWAIAKAHGVVPIIATPDASQKECWHFECRGSHQLVYDHYAAGKGSNMKPATAMAVSGILSLGLRVDSLTDLDAAAIQASLIRLGHDIGNIDGAIGPKTRAVIQQLGITGDNVQIRLALQELLQSRFPGEYFERAITLGETIAPAPAPTPAAPVVVPVSPPPPPSPSVAPPPPPRPAPPEAPPKPAEPKKPLEASRSLWGAIIAGICGVGLAIRDFASSAWTWLESILPFNPAWLFLGLLLLAVFIVIYARLDDRLKGRR